MTMVDVNEKGDSADLPTSADGPQFSQIPAELLRIVFVFAAMGVRDRGRGAPPCAKLSHVNKRWRDIALTTQELWSTVPRKSSEWTSICLLRAPSALLDVILTNDHLQDEGYRTAAVKALSAWPRIRSVRATLARYLTPEGPLVDRSKSMFDALLGTLGAPNATLEQLHLNFTIDSGITGRWTPINLSNDLFGGQHPLHLSDIELSNCALPRPPPPSLFGSGLRSLRLFNTQAWVDIDSMVKCLRAVPMLEKLVYRFSRSPAEGFDFEPSSVHQPRCIPLRHLKTMSLGGFWVQNMAIFSYIAAPSQCHLEVLHCEWDDFVDEMPEEAALELISGCAATMKQHFMPATSQGVAFSSVIPFEFAVWAESNPADPAEASLLPHKLELALPQTGKPSIKRAVFDMVVSQPVVTNTESLFFTADLWKLHPECFDLYINVREIILNGYDDAEALVTALRTRGATIFPVLAFIVLRRFYVEDLGLDLLRELVAELRTDHAASRSFERLVMDDCHYVTQEIVDELRGELGAERVEWEKRDDWGEGQSP
ncbi:unnamed protein product [Peniophora sp. CBMAI 1063]|nr:unnamed protein product [Peniophora sp. CBMAI 1063]